jgi:hypothetical protein
LALTRVKNYALQCVAEELEQLIGAALPSA